MTSMSLSPEVFDALLSQMEDCFCKLAAAQESVVQRPKAELDLLVNLEGARDFMEKILRMQGSRSDLEKIFGGDCMRISRTRAVLEAADFSDMNAGDQRLSTCWSACESVEKVLSDLGLGMTLRRAQEQQRQALQQKGLSECDSPQSEGQLNVTVLNLLGEELDSQSAKKHIDIVKGSSEKSVGSEKSLDHQRHILQKTYTNFSESDLASELDIELDFLSERASFLEKNTSQPDLIDRISVSDAKRVEIARPSSVLHAEPELESASTVLEPASPCPLTFPTVLETSQPMQEIVPVVDAPPPLPELSQQAPVSISVLEPKLEFPERSVTSVELPQPLNARPLQRPSWTCAETPTWVERPLSPVTRATLRSPVHLDPMSHWPSPQKAAAKLSPQPISPGPASQRPASPRPTSPQPSSPRPTLLEQPRTSPPCKLVEVPVEVVQGKSRKLQLISNVSNTKTLTVPVELTAPPRSPSHVTQVQTGLRELTASPRSVTPSRSPSHALRVQTGVPFQTSGLHTASRNSMHFTSVHQPLIQTTQVVARRQPPAFVEQLV